MRVWPRSWLLLLPLVLLTACGGSDGGGTVDASPDVIEAADGSPDPGADLPDAARPEAAEPAADVAVDPGADDGPADVPAEEVLPPPAPEVRFDPAGGFYDWPFPSLLRVRTGGAPDYALLPNPHAVSVLSKYVDAAHALTDGASCNGPAYFGLTRAPDAASLPDVAGSLAPSASAFLVDVDPLSPQRGQRVPAVVSVVTDPVDGYFDPPVLVILPQYGFPLRGATLYAAVLTTALTVDGASFPAPALLAQALNGLAPDDVQAALQPLLDAAPDLGLDLGDVVAATVFRTLDPTRELVALRQAVLDQGLVPTLHDVAVTKDLGAYWRVEGRLDSWNFQQGTPPYAQGGGFTYADDGAPLSKPETLDIAFSLPKVPAATTSGRMPVVIYSHGTGGDYDSFLSEGVAEQLAAAGVACVSVPQPLHGKRWSGSINAAALELASFNFSNPRAGVSTFRQAALDNVLLVQWLVAGGGLPLAGTEVGADVAFDADRLAFMGHSQGGLVAPLVLAVEPRLRGGLISAGGGVLVETILYRQSLDTSADTQIRKVVADLLKIDAAALDERHPMMTLVQNASDLTDPINYAPLVNTDNNRKHLLQVQGGQDPYTPLSTALNLAVALRLPTLAYPNVTAPSDHPGSALLNLGTVSLPVSGNLAVADAAPVTGFVMIFPYSDHFPVFDQPLAKNLYKKFFASMAVDEPPVVQ